MSIIMLLVYDISASLNTTIGMSLSTMVKHEIHTSFNKDNVSIAFLEIHYIFVTHYSNNW